MAFFENRSVAVDEISDGTFGKHVFLSGSRVVPLIRHGHIKTDFLLRMRAV